MGAEQRVLVTRPDGQADSLLEGLRSDGWTPLHLPLIAIEEIDPLPGEVRQRILDLDHYAHVIFVSANAASIGTSRIEDLWPQWPVQQRYWAVGESTAAVLSKAGLRAERPDRNMSSEGLLAMKGLQTVDGERCLLVRGEGGRTLIAETLRERGARVDELPCYRRVAVSYLPEDVDRLFGDELPELLLVSSGEGLELLSRLLRSREGTNLAETTLFVPSLRVAQRAQTLGWERVETVENASDAAMRAAAQRWRERRPGEIQH
ncbi:MAG: uroporphyrinogen-III synthase, partial [Pseudomonadota bacterium]